MSIPSAEQLRQNRRRSLAILQARAAEGPEHIPPAAEEDLRHLLERRSPEQAATVGPRAEAAIRGAR